MSLPEHLTETSEASSAHDRLLEAAKILFASRGYENTTTSAIAKLARTSESQLVKHFGGKEGLLESVFEQGWTRIMRNFSELDRLPEPADKLRAIAEMIITSLEHDRAMKYIFLFEGRRFRTSGEESFRLAPGYLKLIAVIDSVLEEMVSNGQLLREAPLEAIRSAMIGAVEGLLRDRALAERVGFPASYTVENTKTVFRAILSALMPDTPRKL